LAEEGPDDEDLVNKINPPPIMHHRENRLVKSIVKGSKLNLSQKVGQPVSKSKFLAKTSGQTSQLS
jgi:hypothetical protein